MDPPRTGLAPRVRSRREHSAGSASEPGGGSRSQDHLREESGLTEERVRRTIRVGGHDRSHRAISKRAVRTLLKAVLDSEGQEVSGMDGGGAVDGERRC